VAICLSLGPLNKAGFLQTASKSGRQKADDSGKPERENNFRVMVKKRKDFFVCLNLSKLPQAESMVSEAFTIKIY